MTVSDLIAALRKCERAASVYVLQEDGDEQALLAVNAVEFVPERNSYIIFCHTTAAPQRR